jgi:hypothetical protein
VSTTYGPLIALVTLIGLAALGVAKAEATIEPILISGPKENSVNLAFISEGYTSQELDQFPIHVEQMLQYLLSVEPFSEYAYYFNAFAISVASNESGSDDPSRGIVRDTYFNSSFDSWGLSRGLTVPPNDLNPVHADGFGKAESLLQDLLPEYDVIIFIVNDTGFGGWGDFRGVVTALHSYGPEILVHELGHAFAGLGDEYSNPLPNDPYPVLEEPNTTQETEREDLKWRAWISNDTPIPTPENNRYDEVIGLFEGARYEPTGWYRPKRHCKMRGAYEPFCEVCGEQIIRSIYENVDPISSYFPELLSPILDGSQWLLMSVTTTQPTAHDLTVQWSVNGQPQQGAVSTVFNTSALDLGNGTHTIGVEVVDETPRVRSDPDRLLVSHLDWEVHIAGVGSDTTAELYFPFYQEDSELFTGFGASNLSDQRLSVEFTALTEEGTFLSSTTNPRALVIEAAGQTARVGSGLFGLDVFQQQSGWIVLETHDTNIGTLFLTGGQKTLDGAGASLRPATMIFFPEAYEGQNAFHSVPAVSYLSLANPYEITSTVICSLYSRTGDQRATVEVVLPPQGMIHESLEELFGEEGVIAGGYVVAKAISGKGIVGFELIDLPNHNTIVGLTPLEAEQSQHFTALFMSGELADGDSLFTDLKLVNAGEEMRRVNLLVVSENGTSLGSEAMIELRPGEAFGHDVGELLGLGDSSAPFVRGILQVKTDGPGLIGDVVFGDPLGFEFMTALPLQAYSFTKAVFSQVANTEDVFTGVVFYNPGYQAAQLTLKAYAPDGTMTGSKVVSLKSRHSLFRLVGELLPSTSGQVGGSIHLESTKPITAYQSFVSANLNFLAAVTPTVFQ